MGGQFFKALFYLTKMDFYIDRGITLGLADTEEEQRFVADKFKYLYQRVKQHAQR
jgi:hypothetical protein